MGRPFLTLFEKYQPPQELVGIFEQIEQYRLRVDKALRKMVAEITFRTYIPYAGLAAIENGIAESYELAEMRIRPGYDSGLFSMDKMPDVLEELKRRKIEGNGFFAGADIAAELAGAGIAEDSDLITISLKNGGKRLLVASECDKAIAEIVHDWFGIEKRVEFSGKTTLSYEEFLNGLEPPPLPLSAVPVRDGYDKGRFPSQESSAQDNSVEDKPDPALFQSSVRKESDRAASSNLSNGTACSGYMEFDISEVDEIQGTIKDFDLTPIRCIAIDSPRFTICGEVFEYQKKLTRSEKKYIVSFFLTDNEASCIVKLIYDVQKDEEYGKIHNGISLVIRGTSTIDKFDGCLVVKPQALGVIQRIYRRDTAEKKRVELHLHTTLSAMDATLSPQDLVKTINQFGQTAVAVTDHGNLQAYPEVMLAAEKAGAPKILYGMEAYYVNDTARAVYGEIDASFQEDVFVVFDIETTGLSVHTCAITEIGAVKYKNGEILDRFSSFVNPHTPIPPEITELTGITDDMVKDAPDIKQVLKRFFAFAEGHVLVAHNASFDISFLRLAAEKCGLPFSPTYLDTVSLSRYVNPTLKSHKLDGLADHYGLGDFDHHRAFEDAHMLALIMGKMFDKLAGEAISRLSEMTRLMSGNTDPKKLKSYHLIILVKNSVGLKNLYRLVSRSYLDYYYRNPRIPRTLLEQYREGLILGSACEAGELFSAVLEGKPHSDLVEIAKFYDYLEIQPNGNNQFLINNGTLADEQALNDINRTIVALGQELQIPVCATGDVHFKNPEDEIFRQILLSGQKFSDADRHIPLYLRTTDEMLKEFSYLGQDKAYEVVVENTNRIADEIEPVRPIPKGTYPPHMDGAEQELSMNCYQLAKETYGDPLPDIVKERLDKELDSIIKHGFAVLYVIARRLIKFSEEKGYLVGSRGSVGSSFAATMAGITEVNPLPPHYRCPQCLYSEFITDGSVGSGFDLPLKHCPHCHAPLVGDGHDIPFETFLGFNGDKSPDIDLNFSGEVQAQAHKYTEVLFGEDNVFRAGTLGTLASKTAYGFVKKYEEDRGLLLNRAEEQRLTNGCIGVKRTTGQHPGGIIVIPRDKSVYDFTPVQHPADDATSNVVTTHFAFEFLHDTILKLDLLGHDVPTKYSVMAQYTGVPTLEVPLNDPEVMELFHSTKSLGVRPADIDSDVGTFGLPEFGTKFVRQMIMDSKPKNFTDLLQISGLSHGTDVWLGNAQELIKDGTCTISEVIGTRDSIMVFLIYHGLDRSLAFKIMEDVRKGRGLKPEYEQAMTEQGIPEWYIASCKKIKYMFPKAHAAAYVISALRLGWYKVHYPLEFYAAFFTVAPGGFDAEIVMGGKRNVERVLREIDEKGKEATQKENEMAATLQLVNEAYARGIQFLTPHLGKSKAFAFLPENGAIRLPFSSMNGLGDAAAMNLETALEQDEILSIEDLRQKAQLTKAVIEILRKNHVLDDLSETNQLSLFF